MLVEIVQTKIAGRGLVASQDISAGTLLFTAPTIRVPQLQYENYCKFTVFEDYLFVGKSGDSHLALSLGSIFNHAKRPNVVWKLDEEKDEITYTAFVTIKKGDAATISYGSWGRQYEEPSDDEDGDSDASEGDNALLYN